MERTRRSTRGRSGLRARRTRQRGGHRARARRHRVSLVLGTVLGSLFAAAAPASAQAGHAATVGSGPPSPPPDAPLASAARAPIDFDDPMLAEGYSDGRAYSQSKLARIAFTFDLAEEVEGSGIAVVALHPATLMDTGMVLARGIRPRSDVEDGAEAVARLAIGPDARISPEARRSGRRRVTPTRSGPLRTPACGRPR